MYYKVYNGRPRVSHKAGHEAKFDLKFGSLKGVLQAVELPPPRRLAVRMLWAYSQLTSSPYICEIPLYIHL
jgi:hypothetical protein